MPLPYIPPHKAPQPIQDKRSHLNIWVIIVAITFIAVLFILYTFVWQESMAVKKINRIAIQSKNSIANLAAESQDKIHLLQTEINKLEKKIVEHEYCEGGYSFDQCLEKTTTIVGTMTPQTQAHPPIQLLTETNYEYHYIETGFGEIQALRGDRISCTDQVSLTGTLHKLSPQTQNDLAGYYIMVTEYECLE